MKRLPFLFLLTLILFVSCSSLPRRTESPMQKEADELFRLGNEQANRLSWENALHFYRLAQDRYILVDHRKGIVKTKIALIGTLARIEEGDSYRQKLTDLEQYINNIQPLFSPHLLLLKSEIAYLNGDYEKVLTLTENHSVRNGVIDSQIVSYRLLSLLELNRPVSREVRMLQKSLRALRRNYRKSRYDDNGVYSYINYILGYYYLKENDWTNAESCFLTSLQADKIAENSHGIANNLLSLGKVYQGQKEIEKARIHYLKALRIFELLNEKDTVREIQRLLSLL